MKTVEGKYETAKIFIDDVDDASLKQIKILCDMPYAKDSHVRMMPDIFPGKGCTIGTTMRINNRICPNLVGTDIGCGVTAIALEEHRIDLPKLDSVIKKYIPSGYAIRDKVHSFAKDSHIEELHFPFEYSKAQLAIGSLGSGNHFISIEQSESKTNYLIIHTGSRNIGAECAKYYQEQAYQITQSYDDHEIKNIPYELAFVEDDMFNMYIQDMTLIQDYAYLNRLAIADEIMDHMHLHDIDRFETVHNYIGYDDILRKGAIDASKGKPCLIPINMKDGSLICIGKGNEDWNYSGPHGAGRLMSRSQAKQSFTVSGFKKEMKGIYSTTIDESTLDESPGVYKPISSIVNSIKDTCDIITHLKPIYNFKHSNKLNMR